MTRGQYDLVIREPGGRDLPFRLATDPQTKAPIWRSKTMKFMPESATGQRLAYGSLNPEVGDVYGPFDLSDGAGQKFEVADNHPNGKKYWYGKYVSTEIAGQTRKGPGVTALSIAGNISGLNGYFQLAGVPYFVLGKTIASWASDTLTQKFTVADTMTGGATFVQLGASTSIESALGDAGEDSISNSDQMFAQLFRHSATGLRIISSVVLKLKGATTNEAGDVRLRIYSDTYDGVSLDLPGEVLATARVLYKNIGTSAVEVTFNFSESGLVLENDVPYWLILDMPSSSTTNYIVWRRAATQNYARGVSAHTNSGGNAWGGATGSWYFNVYGKAFTETAFVGKGTAATFHYTTDGTTFTADDYRKAGWFCVVSDRLCADVAGTGAIIWTTDGLNWSDPFILGSPKETVTGLYNLNGLLVVAKTGSVWVVDISQAVVGGTDPDVSQVYDGASVSTNGQGGCWHAGSLFVPFGGQVLGISGDLTNGITVTENCGPESLDDGASALGLVGTRALASDRFALWAFVEGTAGIEVFKSFSPLDKKWHGSQQTITTLPSGSDCKMAVVYDPGGNSNPHLFFQHTIDTSAATAAKLGRITLPRTRNPGADASCGYEVTNQGQLFLPYSTGGFSIHTKSWPHERTTFLATASGDSVQWLYDTLDGGGFRVLGPPIYDTAEQRYPNGLASRLLGRKMLINTTTATASLVILGSGVGYNALPLGDQREVNCAILAEDNLTDMPFGADDIATYLTHLATRGTVQVVDFRGNVYTRVRILDAEESVASFGDTTHTARSIVTLRMIGEFIGRNSGV